MTPAITQARYRLTPTELYVVTGTVKPSGRAHGPQYDVTISEVSVRAWPDEGYELVSLDSDRFRGLVERAGQSWAAVEERLIDAYEAECEWLILADDDQYSRDIDARRAGGDL